MGRRELILIVFPTFSRRAVGLIRISCRADKLDLLHLQTTLLLLQRLSFLIESFCCGFVNIARYDFKILSMSELHVFAKK